MTARVILIVLDGCGVGPMPDASDYGEDDPQSATLPHVANAVGGICLPVLESLGLGRITSIEGVRATSPVRGAFGRLTERSVGKDSVTGHWEMMGIVTRVPFPTYPRGFPSDVVDEFERSTGRTILGNLAASGTEIIRHLGEEHLRTGRPIVYTSADSVFQVAAHEDVIPLPELYGICEAARRILVAPHNVARVIARPFAGESSATFRRTQNRRDYPLAPPKPNILSALADEGFRVHAVGVVAELFPTNYFTTWERTQSNRQHLAAIEFAMARGEFDLLFANCEDFDMLYGHRNDPAGFAQALRDVDESLARIVAAMRLSDLLLLTSDHGNDPTTASTDHSREFAPILALGAGIAEGLDLGTRDTFADIGATIADVLGAHWDGPGLTITG
jgi:phosphopentomutase